jgi:hypothetical protein
MQADYSTPITRGRTVALDMCARRELSSRSRQRADAAVSLATPLGTRLNELPAPKGAGLGVDHIS